MAMSQSVRLVAAVVAVVLVFFHVDGANAFMATATPKTTAHCSGTTSLHFSNPCSRNPKSTVATKTSKSLMQLGLARTKSLPSSSSSSFHEDEEESSSLDQQGVAKEEASAPPQEEHVPTTWSEAGQTFFLSSYNGPRAVVLLLAAMTAWRIHLAQVTPLSLADAALFGAMVVFWSWQEHFLHRHVLHSDLDWWGKRIHADHHARPYHHVSMEPAWLVVSWLGVAHVVLRGLCAGPLVWSATAGYATAGLWYQATHFLVHCRVRFRRGSYWAATKDRHARHHLTDSRYWLGFSAPFVDDWLGTNPTVDQVRAQQAREREQELLDR